MDALNKLFNFNVTKKDAGIKQQSYKNITRSRGYTVHDRKYNPDNYSDQILFPKASSCRRESVLVVKAEHFIWEIGLPVRVYLKDKGGKERKVPILKKYQENVKEMLEDKEIGKLIFDKYTKKIDNHAFRRGYVKERYVEIIDFRVDSKNHRS